MRIIPGLDAVTAGDRGAVAAIGNFDGVHLGHRKVIAETARLAAADGAPLAVVTFEPHPRMLFQPDAMHFRLTDRAGRAAALAETGVALLFELNFDHVFSQIPAERFVTDILHDGLGLAHLVIGHDFSFGHRRRGTPEMLHEMAGRLGLKVTQMPAVTEADGAVFSSTRIRQCLSEGDPRGAAALLGRHWSFAATVEEGDRRGRQLGFPTANLRLGDLVHPAHGVYAVRARLDGGETDGARNGEPWRDGVANFGRRPTVNDRGTLFELHLFDFAGDIYGRRVEVRLIDFIRPEMKFPGLDALKAQIRADGARARTLLASER